jgi:hypothetical protein
MNVLAASGIGALGGMTAGSGIGMVLNDRPSPGSLTTKEGGTALIGTTGGAIAAAGGMALWNVWDGPPLMRDAGGKIGFMAAAVGGGLLAAGLTK